MPTNIRGPSPDVEIPLRETILVLKGGARIGIEVARARAHVGDIATSKGARIGWDASRDCKVFWVYS